VTDETATTKPKAKIKPKAKPKAKPVEIPPNPTRPYGTTVYTKRTASKAEAARLVGECEFRLLGQGGGDYSLAADMAAYKRYSEGE